MMKSFCSFILIALLLTILSIDRVSADEMTIIPAIPTTADILQINISGIRAYTNIWVGGINYTIESPDSKNNGLITITMTLAEGGGFEGVGRYDYTVYLGGLTAGTYTINFFEDRSSQLLATHQITVAAGLNIPIDITNSTFQINGTDNFTIHNVSILGDEGQFWGTFLWNPKATTWELTTYGSEQ